MAWNFNAKFTHLFDIFTYVNLPNKICCLCVSLMSPSTPVPDQLLPPTLHSPISAAYQICQPTTSECTTLPDEFFCPTGFFCGRPVGLELIARVPERPGYWPRQFQKTVEVMFVCNLKKHKAEYLYSAFKALWYGSHSLACKEHHACLYLVSFHQIAPPPHYSFIDPERMKCWVDLVGWPPADGLPT